MSARGTINKTTANAIRFSAVTFMWCHISFTIEIARKLTNTVQPMSRAKLKSKYGLSIDIKCTLFGWSDSPSTTLYFLPAAIIKTIVNPSAKIAEIATIVKSRMYALRAAAKTWFWAFTTSWVNAKNSSPSPKKPYSKGRKEAEVLSTCVIDIEPKSFPDMMKWTGKDLKYSTLWLISWTLLNVTSDISDSSVGIVSTLRKYKSPSIWFKYSCADWNKNSWDLIALASCAEKSASVVWLVSITEP
jgi:hypothetical protein